MPSGVLTSEGSRRFKKDGEDMEYTYEDTISFKQCMNRPADPNDPALIRVSVARVFVVYNKGQNILRFAMSNKVSPANGEELPIIKK